MALNSLSEGEAKALTGHKAAEHASGWRLQQCKSVAVYSSQRLEAGMLRLCWRRGGGNPNMSPMGLNNLPANVEAGAKAGMFYAFMHAAAESAIFHLYGSCV